MITSLALSFLLPVVGFADEQESSLFHELLGEGVTIGKTRIKLPPPTLADKLDAADQRAALDKIADAGLTLEMMMRPNLDARFKLKQSSEKTGVADEPAGRIDVWFFVHAGLDDVAGQDFERRWSDLSGGNSLTDDLPTRSGRLSDAEVAQRKLSDESQQGVYYLYSTINLLEKVRISATRRAVVTRTDESLLVAAAVDSRFDDDREYPNQWQPLSRDASGKLSAGKVHLYEGAAFYVKVTKLADPAGMLFIELHQAYAEPKGWFRGANLLRSKLPLLAKDSVREFRRRLKEATKDGEAESP